MEQKFLNQILSFCINLVRFESMDKIEEPAGWATGFIVLHNGIKYLLTAGHVAEKNTTWYWESPLINEKERHVVQIPVGPFQLMKIGKIGKSAEEATDVDFAWCKFSRIEQEYQKKCKELILQGISKKDEWEQKYYQGPLDKDPILNNEPYSYAAWNRAEMFTCDATLKRYPSYETDMTYVGKDEQGIYFFKLIEKHKGHDYYRGASGAPIVDHEGAIVSMVLGGDEANNLIFGAPISEYSKILACTCL
ncbi:MAG: hypothetical protein M0Q48_10400 [Verrucomicrobia bacterium]|nr:hypothetical protein [Verrucomicrobiota bacterium]